MGEMQTGRPMLGGKEIDTQKKNKQELKKVQQTGTHKKLTHKKERQTDPQTYEHKLHILVQSTDIQIHPAEHNICLDHCGPCNV